MWHGVTPYLPTCHVPATLHAVLTDGLECCLTMVPPNVHHRFFYKRASLHHSLVAAKPMISEAKRRGSEVGERTGVSTPGSAATSGALSPTRSPSISGHSKSGTLIWSTAVAPKVCVWGVSRHSAGRIRSGHEPPGRG